MRQQVVVGVALTLSTLSPLAVTSAPVRVPVAIERPHLAGYNVASTRGTVGFQFVQTSTLPLRAERSPVMDSIRDLRTLQDGWLGGRSVAPDPNVLAWLDEQAAWLGTAPQEVSIAPMPDGSVSLQWQRGRDEYTAEVQEGGLYFFVDHRDGDDFEEGTHGRDSGILRAFVMRGVI